MDKDLRKIVKALEAQDFEVVTTRNGHLMVYREGRWVGTFAGTPSDRRGILNTLARLRRAGFRWPPVR